MNIATLESFDNNKYQAYASKAQLEKDLNILKGILFGIKADSLVNQREIGLVKDWIDAVRDFEKYFPYRVFIENLRKVIADDIITEDEAEDLQWLCEQYLDKKNPYYNIITSATQQLTGIISGITADGKVNNEELSYLNDWLNENKYLSNTWLFDEVTKIINKVVEDGYFSAESEKQLLNISSIILSDLGDSDNSSLIDSIKLNPSENEIVIEGKAFCITGNSLYNTRAEIVQLIQDRGGVVRTSVSTKTDYLLICDEKNSCWAFSTYGRKVEKAMQLQSNQNHNIGFLYEVDFYKHIE